MRENMEIDIENMRLAQGLNALTQLQTWLDQALSDRYEFIQEWGTLGSDNDNNGVLMAHLWREEALKLLMSSLRKAICDKYESNA